MAKEPLPEKPLPKGAMRQPNKEIQKELNDKAVTRRRVRFLMINPQDFILLLQKGLVLAKRMQVFEGVPADAKLVSMTVDHVRQGIVLVVESDTYEEVPMTEMPPVQEIAIQQGVKDATKKKRK